MGEVALVVCLIKHHIRPPKMLLKNTVNLKYIFLFSEKFSNMFLFVGLSGERAALVAFPPAINTVEHMEGSGECSRLLAGAAAQKVNRGGSHGRKTTSGRQHQEGGRQHREDNIVKTTS